jgi:Putative peptidoglycan binding domain
MQPRKFRILSAITAGSLALAVAAITASSGTNQPATHAALAAQNESFPPVNLDACPTLHTGYPTGGCVAQLQTDLNIIQGNHLAVDGIFGSVGSQTYKAVIAFQQAHGLPQDGMVGPATKQALDAALSMHTPTMPLATTPAPAPSATAPAPSATAPGTSTASPAPETSGGSPVTVNCGYVSCSYYLSRSSTKAIYDQAFAAEHGPEAATAAVCTAVGIAATPLAGVACGAIAASQGIWIWQEVIDASTQHGAKGACLKLTVNPLLPFPAKFYWSTNNGQYCKD